MELVLKEQSTPRIRTFPGLELSPDEVAYVRAELDEYYLAMQRFGELEPDQIFMALSAYSARMGELRLQLVRRDSRRCTSLRCKEVDPFIEECDRQFKIWSRIVATRTMDWEMTKGQI